MKLFTQEWNPSASRTALLIHGIGSHSSVWYQVAAHLAEQGFHVIAPDLSGHGNSNRVSKYSVSSWVSDLQETLTAFPSPDLIIGHSLGGLLAAGVAVDLEVKPKQIILLDPAWRLPSGIISWIAKKMLSKMTKYTQAGITKSKPTWSEAEILLELDGISKWDQRTVHGLKTQECRRVIKTFFAGSFRATIIKPSRSLLQTRLALRQSVRSGHTLVNLPKVSHNFHRDNFTDFITRVKEDLEFGFGQPFSSGV